DADRGGELDLAAEEVDGDVRRFDGQRGDRYVGDVAAVLADAVELEGHVPRSGAELGLDAAGESPDVTAQFSLEFAEVKRARSLAGAAARASEREPFAQAFGPGDADLGDRGEELAERGADLIPDLRKDLAVAADPAVLDRGRDVPAVVAWGLGGSQ